MALSIKIKTYIYLLATSAKTLKIMIKKIIPFIISIGMISCKTNLVTVDYFGQSAPEASPVIFGKDLIS
jgi:hypothetical protein